MTIKIHSTKKYLNLPCGHAQYFDKEPDGSPGECAAIHGYDRSVEFTFSGTPDSNGWLIPFGELKPIKDFLEYYFDHTTVLPADDFRINSIPEGMKEDGGLLATLRVLPYGVSMEMSSLFIWEHVNPYIHHITNGRAYVSIVECIEHERNSAFVDVEEDIARSQAREYSQEREGFLPQKRVWTHITPEAIIHKINKR